MGADGIRHDMHYIAESTYGTTPATPSMANIRYTGTTLDLTKSELQSAEMYKDRQERVSRHGVKTIGGDISLELSYGTYDDFLESLMQSTFGTGATVTDTDISAAASDNSLNSVGSGFGSFSAGMIIDISGFTGTAANNGIATIVSATSSKIVLAGITLVDDAAGESVTITEFDTLKVGTTRKSFSILRDFEDVVTGRYHLFTGCEASQLTLSLAPDAVVTGGITLIGQDKAVSDSAPAGATFGDPTTTDVFDSFSGVIRDANTALGVGTSLELTIASTMTPKNVIGSDVTLQPASGKIMVTGTLTTFFADSTLYNKFVSETESSLLFSLVDKDGNTYVIYLPKVKYNGGQPDVGDDGPVSVALAFRALYDTTVGSTIAIGKLDA